MKKVWASIVQISVIVSSKASKIARGIKLKMKHFINILSKMNFVFTYFTVQNNKKGKGLKQKFAGQYFVIPPVSFSVLLWGIFTHSS